MLNKKIRHAKIGKIHVIRKTFVRKTLSAGQHPQKYVSTRRFEQLRRALSKRKCPFVHLSNPTTYEDNEKKH